MKTRYVGLAVLLVIGIGCNKTTPVPVGGKGGNATIIVSPTHRGIYVDSCTVYLKYNATDAPTGNYDDSQKVYLIDTTPVAIFAQLKKGQYYIFGDGYHLPFNTWVKGGIPVVITAEDSNFVLLPTSPYIK